MYEEITTAGERKHLKGLTLIVLGINTRLETVAIICYYWLGWKTSGFISHWV